MRNLAKVGERHLSMPSRIREQIFDYYKNSYLSYKSHYYFLGPPIAGASLSCRHDENYLSPTDFCGQNMKCLEREV